MSQCEIVTLLSCLFVYIPLYTLCLEAVRLPVSGVFQETLILGIPIVVLFVISRRMKKFFLFFIMHLLLPGIYYLLAVWARLIQPSYFAAVVVIALISFSVRIWLNDITMQSACFFRCGVLLCINLIAEWQDYPESRRLSFFALFFTVLITFFAINIQAGKEYVHTKELTTQLSSGRMERMNQIVTGVFTAAAAIIMLIASRISPHSLLLALKNLLLGILSYIAGLFPKTGQESLLPESIQEAPEDMQMLLTERGEASLFWIILEKVFYAAACVVLVLAILAALSLICKQIYKSFYAKTASENTDIQEFLSPFQREDRKGRSRKHVLREFFDTTPRKAIRKSYRIRLKGFWGKDEDAPVQYTPTEQCMYKNRQGEAVEEIFLQTYEKARYGKEEPAKEEALMMRRLLREHQHK